ncbi:ATP synthase F1 subunit gamma [Candidatus Roizmanbacteria bacterium RIFCSPHIGHO2_01_FULL_39_12c]|uniref:ATP synthase gamma chain n=1 Tax=Candidatus Roizmanbacteria bacterium RIFCSPHIGHO2_01_FULL_39_12c TaxID=1802031 RepID=A0A1F7GEQ3_9BACT|nr:MAG: ATP synthase F1 subunit gamma [Candidatus Roizmanbacteria bacterium RIFCSPHIGHO2_01_FULL_39_12c]OGK48101.1 MAG: ATP synthase F1 subunit gamma [Candidatus Roizmanbacteria bacterium RIFCSPLOWO2_01_FULL_40_13]
MNLRQVRKKIKSIANVKKITKAMQMVSAIKMKKAQTAAIESKPYRLNLEKIINKLVISLDAKYSSLLTSATSVSQKKLAVLITSNKGLCGVFHFNLFRHVMQNIDLKNTDFITLGKKGALFINRSGSRILADFSQTNQLDVISAVFQTVLSNFLGSEYKEALLIYNKFINTLKYEPVIKTILPVKLEAVIGQISLSKNEYLIEPSARTIIDSLLKSFVQEEIRGAVVESLASEHSARMIAMKSATDNAEDVLYNLTFLRNQLRQEKITYELLDMVTAKESVESS